jgi:hypothetical protein
MWAIVNTVMNWRVSVNFEEFLDQIRDHYSLAKNYGTLHYLFHVITINVALYLIKHDSMKT